MWLAPATSIAEPLFIYDYSGCLQQLALLAEPLIIYGYCGCPQSLELLDLGLPMVSVAGPSLLVYLWLVWLGSLQPLALLDLCLNIASVTATAPVPYNAGPKITYCLRGCPQPLALLGLCLARDCHLVYGKIDVNQ